jgi:lipoprotein signal peptidase
LSNRGLAICVGAIVLAAIVIFQRLLMNIGAEDMKLIPGLADFSPAWNRGVSFSLFARNTDIGRYLSMAVLSVIVIGVLILAWHAQSRLTAAALGLILGGALGNLLDRGLYGGVFDFCRCTSEACRCLFAIWPTWRFRQGRSCWLRTSYRLRARGILGTEQGCLAAV